MELQRQYVTVSPLAYTGKAQAFTYQFDDVLATGQIVEVPLGKRKSLAIVRSSSTEAPDFPTRDITRILELDPLPPYLIELADWLASYYASSTSAVWSTLLPAGLGKKRRALAAPKLTTGVGLPEAPLTEEQTAALTALRTDAHATQLIEGVTGSGKTRIYLERTAEMLAAGKSVIVLVPEITLTPQLVGQFEAAFGSVVISTHSKMTETMRDRNWRQALAAVQERQPRVLIGPRSSLFLPAHNLGLIVIDECHETSYKQEQHPRYDALTAAAKLASVTGAQLVLGSATPALRELYRARTGKIGHIRLTRRAGGQEQPTAHIIDLRDKSLFRRSKFLSEPLLNALDETLGEGRQSLLFMNRRGSASSQICGDCGTTTLCPNCQLPLTFHADMLRLICHHCNYRTTPVAVCPTCGSANLRYLGGGTKRIEAEIKSLFPKARIARLDRDASSLEHLEAVYAGLRDGSIDILIGTQMIAKGLDLPRIDTVGVVSADTILQLPDFTAAERTYALLAQVSGRAGRGDRPGRVLIQTYTPDHPAIQAATSHQSDPLIEAELSDREQLVYPPFTNLLKLSYADASRDAAQAVLGRLALQLQGRPELTIVGPAPSFLETVGKTFRWQLAVKSSRRSALVEIARSVPDTWTADLDPGDLL